MKYEIIDIASRIFSQSLRKEVLRELNFPERHNHISSQARAGRRLSRYLGRLIRADVGQDDIKIIARKIQEEESGRENNEDR